MPVEHVGFSPEVTWGTWVLPATFFPVDTFSIDPGRARLDGRFTGASRALRNRWLGAKAPSGSLSLPAWGEGLGLLIKAAQLTDITTQQPDGVGSPTVYEHAFLPDDSDPIAALSAQAQHSSAIGTNLIGVVMDKMTLSAKAGELVMVEFDWLAKDEAPAGGTWDWDGGASAALIANPTYFASTIRPFIFYDAAIVTGGVVTLDGVTKQLSVAGGTSRTRLETLEITLENNLDARPFLQNDPTPGNVVAQDRAITGKFDYDQSTVTSDFYTEMRAGTQVALQWTLLGQDIDGAYSRELTLTLPLVDFDQAAFADISGSQDRRMRSVEFTGLWDGTLDTDIGITLRDTQVSY